MSWQITINGLQNYELTDEVLTKFGEDNPLYALDAALAFSAAKRAGLASATLGGGRTPSPIPGGEEIVTITITGLAHGLNFFAGMTEIVTQ